MHPAHYLHVMRAAGVDRCDVSAEYAIRHLHYIVLSRCSWAPTDNRELVRITERCKREFDNAHRKRLRRTLVLMRIAGSGMPVTRGQAVGMMRARSRLAPGAIKMLKRLQSKRDKWRRIKQAQRLRAKLNMK